MHTTLTKVARRLVRGACTAALITATVGCGGALRADDGRAREARELDQGAGDRVDVASLSDEQVEARTTRAAISQGKDYVDAIAAGRAARRAAATRRAAAAAGPAAR